MFNPSGHVEDRILPQTFYDTRMERLPGFQDPWDLFGALRQRGAVHRFNQIEEADLTRRNLETETARGTLARSKKTFARELLQNLGEKVNRDSLALGDRPRHDKLAVRRLRQVDKG